jgi:dihydrofolate reductase
MAEPRVTADMSMSLDGFIAGANARRGNPLGDGGERLHQWVYGLESWRERQGMSGGRANGDAEIVAEGFARLGAVVMGRRMFEEGEEPWGDEPPFHVSVFVLTHEMREPLVKKGGTTFVFVNDGIDNALKQARAAAGDKDVSIAGASTIQQFLQAGLLDELQIHLIPVLLGDGVRLFERVGDTELEITRVIESNGVVHLGFRVVKE